MCPQLTVLIEKLITAEISIGKIWKNIEKLK
jgi:hypothetical protein